MGNRFLADRLSLYFVWSLGFLSLGCIKSRSLEACCGFILILSLKLLFDVSELSEFGLAAGKRFSKVAGGLGHLKGVHLAQFD